MIYISLGSNLGNRINNLREAFEILKTRYIRNVSYSGIIETKAILPKNAPISWDKPFLNMLIKGESDLSPEELINQIKLVEFEMGRPKHYEKWAPRIMDIDILL
jgi:2-amino-4-hydroxy-6-hydroxymethyldihydropteridine diphosphokinase